MVWLFLASERHYVSFTFVFERDKEKGHETQHMNTEEQRYKFLKEENILC